MATDRVMGRRREGEVARVVNRDELIAFYLAVRADGLSIVATAERALELLGQPVETAIRSRGERRARDHGRVDRAGDV